jgi:hypothetical protein
MNHEDSQEKSAQDLCQGGYEIGFLSANGHNIELNVVWK